MPYFFKISHWLIGVLLAISTAFQLLALFGGVLFNSYNTITPSLAWLLPLWVFVIIGLIAAFVLLEKKGDTYPWQPILFAVGLVLAVCAFIVAIQLRYEFPDHLIISGETQGLTTWRMVYRHMSSALVGALIALIAAIRWGMHRSAVRAQKEALDLGVSTIGLDSYADGANAAQSPKRRKKKK